MRHFYIVAESLKCQITLGSLPELDIYLCLVSYWVFEEKHFNPNYSRYQWKEHDTVDMFIILPTLHVKLTG